MRFMRKASLATPFQDALEAVPAWPEARPSEMTGRCAARESLSRKESVGLRAVVLVGRAVEDQPAIPKRRYPVGVPLDLVQVLRREDEGPAAFAQCRRSVPEPPALLGIESRRRLVEQQHLGPPEKGDREVQPLAVSDPEGWARRSLPPPVELLG